ncbi:MAG: hypothetical protein ACREAC_27480, partial [Blastocatellia bacterium]
AEQRAQALIKQLAPVGSESEFSELLSGGKEALWKGGEGDLADTFEAELRKLYPQFAQEMDAQKQATDTYVENLGYDAQSLEKHSAAVDKDTNKLGGGGAPGGSETKHARGGMVLSPVRALIGEAGPEWITPFHEIRDRAARDGHGIVIHAPMTFHGTSAKDAEAVKAAVKEALQEAGDEIMRGLERYNKGYDPTE